MAKELSLLYWFHFIVKSFRLVVIAPRTPEGFYFMANGKKSFVLYCDLIHTFDELTDTEAGKLIKHIFAYVNDLDPKTNNKVLKVAFQHIKHQLKRDLIKWEDTREKRSKAGQISAERRKQKSTNSTHVKSVQHNSTKSTVNDNVTVNVNDTVSKYILKEGECERTIEYCAITMQRRYTPERMQELWKAFLIQNEAEIYATKPKQLKHFQNWIKNQPGDGKQKLGTSEARLVAVKNF